MAGVENALAMVKRERVEGRNLIDALATGREERACAVKRPLSSWGSGALQISPLCEAESLARERVAEVQYSRRMPGKELHTELFFF